MTNNRSSQVKSCTRKTGVCGAWPLKISVGIKFHEDRWSAVVKRLPSARWSPSTDWPGS